MSITILLPNSLRTGSANFNNVGGAVSYVAAVSDGSDTTYILKNATGTASIIYDFATTALSSTQRIKQIRVEVRCQTTETDSKANVQLGVRKNGVNYFGPAYQIRGVDALATYAAPWYTSAPNGEAWSKALLDTVMVQVTDYKDAAARAYIYELQVDVDIANAPTTVVSAPAGTITTTSKPDISWTFTDGDGEAQAFYQIKVFTAAQYAVAGFSPTTSTGVYDSGTVASADTTAPLPVYLANSTNFRVYVRTGKSVNGEAFWSEWADSSFLISLTPPTAPTMTATYSSGTNSVTLVATGAAAAGYDSQTFQIERSPDAATWTVVRDGEELVPNGSYAVTLNDYDAERGGTVYYRARSIGVLASNEVASDYGASASVSVVNDGTWWMKAVTDPSLNLGGIRVIGQPQQEIREDVGVFTPIGRSQPVVISAGLSGVDGAYDIHVTGATEWDDFYPLMTHVGVVLVQSPFGDQQYVRFTGRSVTLLGTTDYPRREVSLKYVTVSGD